MNFNIKICPFCDQQLMLKYNLSSSYSTSESTYTCFKDKPAHYKVVIISTNISTNVLQKIYFKPYLIVNKMGSNISKIYKFNDALSYKEGILPFKEIMSVPMIIPKSKEHFFNKIKVYLTFS